MKHTIEIKLVNRRDSILAESGIIKPEKIRSVLVGYFVMELLDLCYDVNKGLIYNPAYRNEWIEDQFFYLIPLA